MFPTIAAHDSQAESPRLLNWVVSPVAAPKFSASTQYRTNALADFSLVPFAAAGMVGGVTEGEGELVSVGVEADADPVGRGAGSGLESHPVSTAVHAPAASKAANRPARVRNTSNDPLRRQYREPPKTGLERPQQLIHP